jgi:hypothetical protein
VVEVHLILAKELSKDLVCPLPVASDSDHFPKSFSFQYARRKDAGFYDERNFVTALVQSIYQWKEEQTVAETRRKYNQTSHRATS